MASSKVYKEAGSWNDKKQNAGTKRKSAPMVTMW